MLHDEVTFSDLVAMIHTRVVGTHTDGNGRRETNILICIDELDDAINCLATLYITLSDTVGMAARPDMLRHPGLPGQLLHDIFCKHPGIWRAFRLWVAQQESRYPYPTPLLLDGVTHESQQELYVGKTLRRLSGITAIDTHPYLPDGLYTAKADLRLTVATGEAVYVEVVMVASNADADTVVCAEYRERLLKKMRSYARLGLSPVVIWADEAACPRALAVRLNDILARLGLPTRPPAPPYWYELPGEVPFWSVRDVLRPGRDSFGGLV